MTSIPELSDFKKIAKDRGGRCLSSSYQNASTKLKWECSKGHVWEALPHSVKRGTWCPYCAGRKVLPETSLGFLYPKISKEWHPTKNGSSTPFHFVAGSGQRVWWKCAKGDDHEWQTSIYLRAKHQTRCPFCSGNKSSFDNNFQKIFPDLAREWHPIKNQIKPHQISPKSGKKVYWLCDQGHSYKASVAERTRQDGKNTGCPFCAGKMVSPENSLRHLNPEIVKEWHPTKNNGLRPEDFTPGSSKKVFWQCSRGHTFKSAIKERTGKHSTNCPYCSPQTSKPEMRIMTELMYFFDDVISRHKIKNTEIDAFIPSLNLAIEYDGSYFHRSTEKRDLEKNRMMELKGIRLIRIRHRPLRKLSENDILVRNESLDKADLNRIIRKVMTFCDDDHHGKVEDYLSKSEFANEELYKKYLSYFPSPLPEKSLLIVNPEIAAQWDHRRNFPLSPANFSYGSKQEVFWLCDNGHSYVASISRRTGPRKGGCPYCSGRKVGADNNLEFLYPDIAKQWHPTKNGNKKPSDFTKRSGQKVFWICPLGHTYEASIAKRTRTDRSTPSGCPICRTQKKK